jgi:hypothetical protein
MTNAKRIVMRGMPITDAERMYALDEGSPPLPLPVRRGRLHLFVTHFTGTFTAPLEMPDGTVIQPTGQPFDVIFSTTARWRDGKIVEEYLFYDNGTFLRQVGLA